MTKEFNLSKRKCDNIHYHEEDVKEFIKRLKEEIGNEICYCSDYNPCCKPCSLIKFIDKLSGDELI